MQEFYQRFSISRRRTASNAGYRVTSVTNPKKRGSEDPRYIFIPPPPGSELTANYRYKTEPEGAMDELV